MAKIKKASAAEDLGKTKRAASAAVEPEEAPTKTPGKNTGRTTGMRIGEYQDHTLAEQHKNRLTDEELGENWSKEFPEARCKFQERMDIVRVVRRLYNEGRHYNNEKPKEPVPRYEIQNGRRVAVVEEARPRRDVGTGAKLPAKDKAADR